MTQPENGYYNSPAWRTPAELDAQRWRWLQETAMPTLGHALDDILTRLDRVEQKLDMLIAEEPPRRTRRRKVASEPDNVEQ